MLSLLSAKLFRGLDIPVTYICGDDGANTELAALGVSIVQLNSRDLINAERAKAFVAGIHNVFAVRMIATWIRANDTPNTAIMSMAGPRFCLLRYSRHWCPSPDDVWFTRTISSWLAPTEPFLTIRRKRFVFGVRSE